MHDDEIDIERAGREPDYRRQLLARLKDRKSTRPNSSHLATSYAAFRL